MAPVTPFGMTETIRSSVSVLFPDVEYLRCRIGTARALAFQFVSLQALDET